MGVNYFTDEQVFLLKDNPYIESVTNKSIKYSKQFKEEFWNRYSHGETPSAIVLSFGLNPKILGRKRMDNIVQRIKKEAERLEMFEDKRKYNNGRPVSREMSDAEKIAYLEHKLAYKEQEIEFLKKIRFVQKQWEQELQDYIKQSNNYKDYLKS